MAVSFLFSLKIMIFSARLVFFRQVAGKAQISKCEGLRLSLELGPFLWPHVNVLLFCCDCVCVCAFVCQSSDIVQFVSYYEHLFNFFCVWNDLPNFVDIICSIR